MRLAIKGLPTAPVAPNTMQLFSVIFYFCEVSGQFQGNSMGLTKSRGGGTIPNACMDQLTCISRRDLGHLTSLVAAFLPCDVPCGRKENQFVKGKK